MSYLTEIFLIFYAGIFTIAGENKLTRVLGLIGIVFAVIGIAEKLKA